MSLRRDSTPLDFAYAVHTEVGNHCVGAKVNGSVVPLTYKLNMGDRVEVLTNKNAKPSRDWMNIVVTPSARAKIRKYFSVETRADDAEQGRSELAHELRRRGYGISTQRTVKAIERVYPQFDYRTPDDLFAGIGTGKVSAKQVANRIEEDGSRRVRQSSSRPRARRLSARPSARRPSRRTSPSCSPTPLRRLQRAPGVAATAAWS